MEETKKCRSCQMDIPKKARRCPHCRTKQGIGIVGLFFAIIFAGMVLSIVMGSLPNDNSYTPPADVGTYVPPERTGAFELGTYRVESTEFEYMGTNEVNLWQSYSNRTLVGKMYEGDIVEVIEYEASNDYCYIEKNNQKGWAACGWLVKVE